MQRGSFTARLSSLEREVVKRGLHDDGAVCPVCGGGGDGRGDTSRLIYFEVEGEEPELCDHCSGRVDSEGIGYARECCAIRFLGEFTPRDEA